MSIRTHKIFLLSMLAVTCAFNVQPSSAQDCEIVSGLILTLKEPRMGAYSVWDTQMGQRDTQESFVDGILLGNREILTVGVDPGRDFMHSQIIFAQTRINGRVRWQKRYSLSGVEGVFKLLRAGDELLVFVNRRDAKAGFNIWVGRFDMAGNFIAEQEIKNKTHDVMGHDVIVNDGVLLGSEASYIVASSTLPKVRDGLPDAHREQQENAVLLQLDKAGKVIADRALATGSGSRMNDLAVVPGEGLLGSGYSFGADGRKNGWVVRIDQHNDLLWQQQYPRGAGAVLSMGEPLLSDAFLLIGSAAPAEAEASRAGFVMAVSKVDGAVLWQRYLRSQMDLDVIDMNINDEGVGSLLINAAPFSVDGKKRAPMKEVDADIVGTDEEYKVDIAHLRLLTFSPRGELIDAEAYFNGQGVTGHKLLNGYKGQRVMIGQSDVLYRPEEAMADSSLEMEGVVSRDAWMAAAQSVNPFEDPCKPVQYRTP